MQATQPFQLRKRGFLPFPVSTAETIFDVRQHSLSRIFQYHQG